MGRSMVWTPAESSDVSQANAVLHGMLMAHLPRRLTRPYREADAPVRIPTDAQASAGTRISAFPTLAKTLSAATTSATASAGVRLAMPPALEAAHGVTDQDALEEAQRNGQEQGYQSGYQEGMKDAQQEAHQHVERRVKDLTEQRVRQALAEAQLQTQEQADRAQAQLHSQYGRLNALFQEIPQELNRYLEDGEDDMLALMNEVVCRLLGEEAASASGLRSQLRHHLKSWHGRAQLNLHLHPDDVALLQADKETAELLRGAGFSVDRASLHWIADPDIVLGGCKLRSSEGALDARLEVQLQALKTTLLHTRATRNNVLDSAALERSE